MSRQDFVDVLESAGQRNLTERQRSFAVHFVKNGGNATRAAIAAGYSGKAAREQGYKLLRNPSVARAVRTEQMALIGGTLATRALYTLKSIMEDENAPAGARVDAAKTLLDRGGIPAIPATLLSVTIDDKDPGDMTADELRAFIRQGSAQLAEMERERTEKRAIPALEHEPA